MWPFKSTPKVTVKEAFEKRLPVLFAGLKVTKIEYHGKGYGPRPMGNADRLPDQFLISIETGAHGETKDRMLSENEKLELDQKRKQGEVA